MGISDDSSLSLEYLRTHINGLSANTRVRRSAEASASQTVQYASSTNKMFKVREGMANYLQVSNGNTVTVGPQNGNNNCFQVHEFDLLSLVDISGLVVVLQTHDSDFLKGSSNGEVSLVEGSDSITSAEETDGKFFIVENDGEAYKIKHFLTEKYLSASPDSGSVTLVSGDNGFTDDMLFDMYHCTGDHS